MPDAVNDPQTRLLNALMLDLRKARPKIERYDRYYEGEQPLRYMAPELVAMFGTRITQLVINWCRLGADAHEERLDLVGFRYGSDTGADDDVWDWFTEQGGEYASQQANLEAIICGRSYALLGANDAGDDAVLTVEHPLQCIHRSDPRTGKVSAGAKTWLDDEGVTWANLYVPGSTFTYRRSRGWVLDDVDEHEIDDVLLVPLVNRGRIRRPLGVSEFHDVIPVADAANKMATDMMISGEFHAMPRRYALGVSEDDFVDENGKPLSSWEQIAGRIWSTESSEVEVGQWTEADLANFHNTLKLLAQIAGQLLALPTDHMAFSTSNPPSAESINASATRLIKRAERRQTGLNPSYAQIPYLRDLIRGKSNPTKPKPVWGDPAAPTRAQKADAAVKLRQARITSLRQTWDDLGYTPEEQDRMLEDLAEEAKASLAGLNELGFGAKPDPGAENGPELDDEADAGAA